MNFVPRGYGGFPSFQFSPPNQINNRYYNDGYRRRDAYFAPHYPPQPLYQPPFNPGGTYSSIGYDRARRPSIGAQLIMAMEELDQQYRYDQYLRKLEKIEIERHKIQNRMARYPPMYTGAQPFAPSMPYNPGAVAEYRNPTRYKPYPVAYDPSARGYDLPFNASYGGGPTVNFEMGGGMSLPPKIRVIFIPPGQSFSQQPCTGPLAMPSFLYNRMSEPLCSFPLPPPLPQLGSMSLTPAVQQMVMQRYSNPVAVLPYSSNWQTPQMMMPSFPQAIQQQQQSMPAFQSCPPNFQSYIPPFMPAFSSLPPVPQTYISTPSVSTPAYMPAFSSLPPAPQSYISSSTTMSTNSSMPQQSSSQLPLPYANAFLSSSQYSNGSYPSMCRVCPPAPPPLNMLVTGHCWVQHCSACHNVSTPDSNPNVRPASGRSTPLLRHPTVPQYVPDQTQQQQDPRVNMPVMMRPWLRKTPPLPPGAVIISQEYVNKDNSRSRYQHSQSQDQRLSRTKHRSSTSTSKSTSASSLSTTKTNQSISPRRVNQNNSNLIRDQKPLTPKKLAATSSSSSSSSGLSAEYHKTTVYPSKTNQDNIPQHLAGESRNINLQYNYQPQELPTVYNTNRYLTSGSEGSTLSPKRQTSPDYSPRFIKGSSRILSSTSGFNSIKEESDFHKEDGKPPRTPFHSQKPKEKLIIIREFIASSPSTTSTVSSNSTFSIIDKDIDSVSTTSTIKTFKLDDDDDTDPEMF